MPSMRSRIRQHAAARAAAAGVDRRDEPSSETVTATSRAQPLRQESRLEMVAAHLDYTCIGNQSCRMILASAAAGDQQCKSRRAKDWDRIWVGANIATMVAGGEPYGNIKNAALAVKGERIAWIGPAAEGGRDGRRAWNSRSTTPGLWMTPGLIDCHTHLVYGGNRVEEFEKRLCGVSYEDIARAGGGIQSTVHATRAADAPRSCTPRRLRARRLMAEGVTTLEVKSGYGLELEAERRMLEVARDLGCRTAGVDQDDISGLARAAAGIRADRQGFVDHVCGPWLESLAAADLVDAVDAFCENIAFSVAETEQLLRAAKQLGLPTHAACGPIERHGRRGAGGEVGRALRRSSRST